MIRHRCAITVIALGIALPSLAACGAQEPVAPPEVRVEGGEEDLAEDAEVVAEEPETLLGEFITTEGEHVVDGAGRFEIHVVSEGNLLNYSVRVRTATPRPGATADEAASRDESITTTGPKDAAIDPNAEWFIYVESEGRYWVFDGSARVTLFEYSGPPRRSTTTMTDLESAPDRLRAEMPTVVRDRLPPAVLADGG